MSCYVLAFGTCLVCKRSFGFNPHLVPSSSAVTGDKEPICGDCFEVLNAERKRRGLEPFTRHPDAYEPLDEGEL